jgi:hypothetical protein
MVRVGVFEGGQRLEGSWTPHCAVLRLAEPPEADSSCCSSTIPIGWDTGFCSRISLISAETQNRPWISSVATAALRLVPGGTCTEAGEAQQENSDECSRLEANRATADASPHLKATSGRVRTWLLLNGSGPAAALGNFSVGCR